MTARFRAVFYGYLSSFFNLYFVLYKLDDGLDGLSSFFYLYFVLCNLDDGLDGLYGS